MPSECVLTDAEIDALFAGHCIVFDEAGLRRTARMIEDAVIVKLHGQESGFDATDVELLRDVANSVDGEWGTGDGTDKVAIELNLLADTIAALLPPADGVGADRKKEVPDAG